MIQLILAAAIGLLASFTPMVVAAPVMDLITSSELSERASCTFTTAAAAIKGKTSCSTIILSNIAVPAGTTLDLTGLTSGTTVTFSGTTTFGYEEWSGPLISVSGANVIVNGEPDHLIDGGGPSWWDGFGTNTGGKTKPQFFAAHSLTGKSSITGLNVKNTPVQAFSIDGSSGLSVTSVTIDNSAGDAGGLGHNTDGFDIGSSDSITITGAIVHNQDDCLAINSGTNIIFTGGACTGGHGLSIGSVGGRSDNTVKTVIISSTSVTNSQNGVRVKTVKGATGSVTGVTYKDITLSGITDYGVIIEQNYLNSGATGAPTAGVPITGLTLNGVTGTVTSGATEILIVCAACSGWTWEGVDITGGKSLKGTTTCQGIPTGASC